MKIKELFLVSLITVTSIGNIKIYAQNQEAQAQETWGNWLGRQKERYKPVAKQWIPTDFCFNFERNTDLEFGSIESGLETGTNALRALICVVAAPTGAISGIGWQLLKDGSSAISEIIHEVRNKLITPAQANNQIKEILAKVKAEAEAHREEQHEF